MVKAANGFPRMLEALKDQVGAVYQCPIEIEEYRSCVAVLPAGVLFYIENQSLNYIDLYLFRQIAGPLDIGPILCWSRKHNRP